MALADVVTLATAFRDVAHAMRCEEAIKSVDFKLENTRLSRDDLELIGQAVSPVLPCLVKYELDNELVTVTLVRKSV